MPRFGYTLGQTWPSEVSEFAIKGWGWGGGGLDLSFSRLFSLASETNNAHAPAKDKKNIWNKAVDVSG